jgi:1,4-alpha-glucan branching enzyme
MGKKKSLKDQSDSPDSFSLLTDFDIHLFKTGKHFKLHEKLGAHLAEFNGDAGTYFAVWAPNARTVSVIGNFNQWHEGKLKLNPRWDESGIWEGFFSGHWERGSL